MAAVVHVHVQVGAEAISERAGSRCAFSATVSGRRFGPGSSFDVCRHRRSSEAVLHPESAVSPAGTSSVQRRGAMEIVRLAATAARGRSRRQRASTPSWRLRAPVAAEQSTPVPGRLALVIADVERQVALGATCIWRFVASRCASRAADDLLHRQGWCCQCLVADVRDALAVGRPARVAPVEFAEGQRQAAPRHRASSATIVPLAAVIAGEQHPLAVGREFRARVPAGLFAAGPCGGRAGSSTATDQMSPVPQATSGLATIEMRLPSGDHDGLIAGRRPNSNSGRSCSDVRRAAGACSCKPSAPMSAMNRLKWPVPSVETQAMRVPSGDRRGSTLTAPPESARCSRPLARSSRHSSSALPS